MTSSAAAFPYFPGVRLLHSPGPSNVPKAVLDAMTRQPMDMGDPRVDACVDACEAGLKNLTGQDASVAEWLAGYPAVSNMAEQIAAFLNAWLPDLSNDHRSYVTVAICCTGGQHRSVYLVELLTKKFVSEWVTLKRHRELDTH